MSDSKKGKSTEDGAFKRAFGTVKPLRPSAPRRAPRQDVPPAPVRRTSGATGGPPEALEVERETNGIITGRRSSTHRSILEALEDPRIDVEAELDLHGLTTKEAEREVLRFVQTEHGRGRRWVCIVVGKGLHSPGGKGTLRDHVVSALSRRSPARYVLAFGTAPRRLGGTGALVVRLVDRVG